MICDARNYLSDVRDDSIKYFLNEYEDSHSTDAQSNSKNEIENKKKDRKRFFGGPSEESFLVLSHLLRGFNDAITFILVKIFLSIILIVELKMNLLRNDLT